MTIVKYEEKYKSAMKAMFAASDNCHWVKDLKWGKCFSVALLESAVVGYLFASIQKENCQIYIYVLPEYRRCRIGTALCNEAERLCRDKNEPLWWGIYYAPDTIHFINEMGIKYVSSSVHFEYSGDVLYESEICKNIRNCRKEDYFPCMELWSQGHYDYQLLVGNPYAKKSDVDLTKEVTDDDINCWYVLEVDGQIIGCGSAKDGDIGALAVNKEHVGKGYGAAVATYMLNEMLREGHKVVTSCCEKDNIPSLRLHEKLGFKVVRTSYAPMKKIDKIV